MGMKNVFIVLEANVEQGIEMFVFSQEQDAVECYNTIVNEYKEIVGELGDGEITNHWAEITNKYNEEIAKVFIEEKFVG